jgi:hypothetical protein
LNFNRHAFIFNSGRAKQPQFQASHLPLLSLPHFTAIRPIYQSIYIGTSSGTLLAMILARSMTIL